MKITVQGQLYFGPYEAYDEHLTVSISRQRFDDEEIWYRQKNRRDIKFGIKKGEKLE